MRTLLLPFLVLSISLNAQELISGIVKDSLSGEALPYCSVRLTSGNSGTTTNAIGAFTLRLSEGMENDSLEFSFVGYVSKRISLSAEIASIEISLVASDNVLKVFTVRPISAAEQVKRSVKRVPQNYATKNFNGQSYYRQVIQENENYLDYSEGVFVSHFDSRPFYPSQHQLALYREPFTTSELQVMSRRAEKQRRKYLKKNPEKADSIPATVTESLETALAGPSVIFTYDVKGNELIYLDTNNLHKFKYEYGKESVLNGRDLLTVKFTSKGTVENARRWGTLFIDIESDAIVMIKEGGDIKIPAIVKPLLLIAGIGIKKPTYHAELRYQLRDSIWYPEFIYWNIDLELIDKPIFGKNQRADFFVEQLMDVQRIEPVSCPEIPKGKRFDREKEMDAQVYPHPGLSWEGIDVIR